MTSPSPAQAGGITEASRGERRKSPLLKGLWHGICQGEIHSAHLFAISGQQLWYRFDFTEFCKWQK